MLIPVLALLVPPASGARECLESTAPWSAMETREITLADKTGTTMRFLAKIADDGSERAAGFQHLCPHVIEEMPMLFLFGGELRPTFHMRNVHRALDIAFIDANGRIDEIKRMDPYVLGAVKRPLYRSRLPVFAAMEAHAGFFAQQGIVAGRWKLTFPD